MNKKSIWTLPLIVASALVCLTPSVRAAELSLSLNGVTEATNGNALPLEIAQSSYCPDTAGGTPMVAFYETDNFWVYICAADGLYYHGIEKGSGNYVTLPAYTEEGTGYVAVNGDYTYIVNGATLSIYEGSTLLQEDSVY
jgi:hypothetical protein